MQSECDNCRRLDSDLEAVHRIYLQPEVVTVTDAEWWCASCRTQYPHEPAVVEDGERSQ